MLGEMKYKGGRMKSDFAEIFWSIAPLALWLLVVFALIMAAPSIEAVLGWWK